MKASETTSASAPPSARAPDDDEDLFEVTVDAEEAALSAEERASDPDRTPLPIAEGAEELGGAQPLRVMQLGESRPVVAARIVLSSAESAASLPALTVPDVVAPSTLDTAYLRDQLALYDTERLLSLGGQAGARGAARLRRRAHRREARRRRRRHRALRGGARGRADAHPRVARAASLAPRRRQARAGARHARPRDRRGVDRASGAGCTRCAPSWRWRSATATSPRASYDAILQEQADDLGALSGLVDLAASSGDDAARAGARQALRSARQRRRAVARRAPRRARAARRSGRPRARGGGALSRGARPGAGRCDVDGGGVGPVARRGAYARPRRRRRDPLASRRAVAGGSAASGGRAAPRPRARSRRRCGRRATGAASGRRRRQIAWRSPIWPSSSAPTAGSKRRRRR